MGPAARGGEGGILKRQSTDLKLFFYFKITCLVPTFLTTLPNFAPNLLVSFLLHLVPWCLGNSVTAHPSPMDFAMALWVREALAAKRTVRSKDTS